MTKKQRTDLGDPRIDHAHRTSKNCPEEYVGRLVDGRWFYFRYRWGVADVGIGHTIEDAIDATGAVGHYGGMYDGEWPDAATRNEAFAHLLTDALNSGPEPLHPPPCPDCGSDNIQISDSGIATCQDCRHHYLADT